MTYFYVVFKTYFYEEIFTTIIIMKIRIYIIYNEI